LSLNVQVKIDVILHSTENQEKIFNSFFEVFDLKRDIFQIQNLIGHFENPITLVSVNLKKKNAEVFINSLLDLFTKKDYNEIYENIEENMPSSGLKIKISKQKMIEGKIILENSDAIKINIASPVYVKKDSKKIYQQLLRREK